MLYYCSLNSLHALSSLSYLDLLKTIIAKRIVNDPD